VSSDVKNILIKFISLENNVLDLLFIYQVFFGFDNIGKRE